jgi:hypothetical protein
MVSSLPPAAKGQGTIRTDLPYALESMAALGKPKVRLNDWFKGKAVIELSQHRMWD